MEKILGEVARTGNAFKKIKTKTYWKNETF